MKDINEALAAIKKKCDFALTYLAFLQFTNEWIIELLLFDFVNKTIWNTAQLSLLSRYMYLAICSYQNVTDTAALL